VDSRYRFVVGFLTVLNALLTMLLCGLVRDTRHDVNALRDVLATKQDLVNVAVPRLTMAHEGKCTTCHSEQRFAGEHNVRGHMEAALTHMQQLPDAPFSAEETARIHGSLQLLRCAECHDRDQLRQLAIASPAERMRIVREMADKPGSRVSPDEVSAILLAFEQTVGF
jgi:hypothetical protein